MDRFQARSRPRCRVRWWAPRTPSSAAITASIGTRCATSIDDAEDGEVARGGSTITQQVAKNLFLWPGRSVVRKALELPLALWIDLVLPKQRILEIYLNIAELGPSGQFGAEAGSQLRLRPFGRDPVAARGGPAGGDPAQSGQAQRPQSRPRGAAAGRDLYGAGQCRGVAALLERKSCILSRFSARFNRIRP